MKEKFEIKEIESSIDLNDTETVIIDTKTNGIISFDFACKLLNYQDEKIKELEKENKRLLKNWKNSKLQQKQKLHTHSLKICEKIRLLVEDKAYSDNWIFNYTSCELQPLPYKQKSIHCRDLFEILEKVANGRIKNNFGDLLSENAKLKQSQNCKAIEVLERLRQDFFGNPYNGKHEYVVGEIIDKIDIKLAELRGVEND